MWGTAQTDAWGTRPQLSTLGLTAHEPPPPGFMDKLMRKLVDDLTQYVIDGVYPVKIVKIEGDTAYLNRGEGGGLKKGEQLQVFSVGDEIRDLDTGELLGRTEIKVGILTVEEILRKMSY